MLISVEHGNSFITSGPGNQDLQRTSKTECTNVLYLLREDTVRKYTERSLQPIGA